MAKRKTVNVNTDKIIFLAEANEWNKAAFARKVGKHSRWLSEVARGRNLPSPEEAAQMCLLLHTTPEEILPTEGETAEETAKCQEDIALVRKLLEEMQSATKAPAEKGEGLDEKITRLYAQLPKLSDRQREMILGIVDEMLKNGET
jgi:transcriptional regulator with XRE-family HTH domain